MKRNDKTLRKYSLMIMLSSIVTLFGHAQQPIADRLRQMMPEIPPEITEPARRATFLVSHYWDQYDFRDTAFLRKDDFLERSLVDYLDLLSLVPEDVRTSSAGRLMKKAEATKDTYLLIARLVEQYLYHPDSPLSDEEKYIPFLQEEIKSSVLSATEKIRPHFLLANVMKNRTGHLAADFTYTRLAAAAEEEEQEEPQTGTLHAIRSDYTLLYFLDPSCEECQALTRKLAASPVIRKGIGEKTLTLLTVYLLDDLESWKTHAPTVPGDWIYARDAEQTINARGVYDIKRLPTIYLLDKDKKVLLKDTTFEKTERYLMSAGRE
jgi:hypothetical protein